MSEESKRCGRCGETKPLEEFAWRRQARGQRHNYCRPCHSEYHREHYLANKQRYIDNAAKRRRKMVEERVRYLVEFLRKHPCADCGERDVLVLEFDHRRDKLFEIGKGLHDRSWQSILDEIAKCDVVCANCHRRRTARRRGSFRVVLAKE